MSEDIKKTISELHIYEKKLLKELEANPKATPDEIASNTGMDIKSVMSAAGSLASKDIIEVHKDVEKTYSLTEDGREYAEHGLPERKILDVLAQKKEIAMKDLADEAGIDKKETGIALGWLRQKNWAQIDKGVINITDIGKDFADKSGVDFRFFQNKLTWLVSGMLPKAPASFSIWIWVLETLGQAAATSSTEMKFFPSLPSIRSQAALSPRPEMETKGGSSLPSLIKNLVAWLS